MFLISLRRSADSYHDLKKNNTKYFYLRSRRPDCLKNIKFVADYHISAFPGRFSSYISNHIKFGVGPHKHKHFFKNIGRRSHTSLVDEQPKKNRIMPNNLKFFIAHEKLLFTNIMALWAVYYLAPRLSTPILLDDRGKMDDTLVLPRNEHRAVGHHLNIVTDHDQFIEILVYIQNDETFDMRHLVDIYCVDTLGKDCRFCLIYKFFNFDQTTSMNLYIFIGEGEFVNTAQFVYKNSVWLEREVWEMSGIYFYDHSSLQRILSDYSFKGHPMRKDFPMTGYLEQFYSYHNNLIETVPVEFMQEYRQFEFYNSWDELPEEQRTPFVATHCEVSSPYIIVGEDSNFEGKRPCSNWNNDKASGGTEFWNTDEMGGGNEKIKKKKEEIRVVSKPEFEATAFDEPTEGSGTITRERFEELRGAVKCAKREQKGHLYGHKFFLDEKPITTSVSEKSIDFPSASSNNETSSSGCFSALQPGKLEPKLALNSKEPSRSDLKLSLNIGLWSSWLLKKVRVAWALSFLHPPCRKYIDAEDSFKYQDGLWRPRRFDTREFREQDILAQNARAQRDSDLDDEIDTLVRYIDANAAYVDNRRAEAANAALEIATRRVEAAAAKAEAAKAAAEAAARNAGAASAISEDADSVAIAAVRASDIDPTLTPAADAAAKFAADASVKALDAIKTMYSTANSSTAAAAEFGRARTAEATARAFAKKAAEEAASSNADAAVEAAINAAREAAAEAAINSAAVAARSAARSAAREAARAASDDATNNLPGNVAPNALPDASTSLIAEIVRVVEYVIDIVRNFFG